MHSPLNKRLPRELRNNLGKYLSIFLLMGIAIAMTSGFLVAASSIQRIAEEMPEITRLFPATFTSSPTDRPLLAQNARSSAISSLDAGASPSA